MQCFVRDVTDEEVTDDWFRDGGEGANAKTQIVQNLNHHSVWNRFESPDHAHAFGPCLQVMEMNLAPRTIDNLLGSPRNRNSGTRCRHDNYVSIYALFEITDVTIMREDFWPKLEIGGCLEDRFARCLDDDGVAGVHESIALGEARRMISFAVRRTN